MVLLIGLTLCLLLTVIKGQDSCQESIVLNCSEYLLSTSFDYNQLAVPKDSIESTCGRVDDAKKCIEDYIDNCHTTKTKEDFIQDGGKVLLEACDFLRTKYTPHIPCFTQLSGTYKRCTAQIKNIVSDKDQILHIQNGIATTAEITSFCCGVHKIFECVAYPTFTTCGPEAAQTMEVFLRRQLPPPLLLVCDNFQCDDTTTTEITNETTTETTTDHTITYNETYLDNGMMSSSSQLSSILALVLSLNLISFLNIS